MSKNSGGRGRGWLNLNKNNSSSSNMSNPVVPVGNLSNHVIQSTNDENLFVDAQEYNDLVNIVKKLNIDDDGIKFNQKIRHLLEQWKAVCLTSDDVEKSFESIYQNCLRDEDLASKLVYMISSRSFLSQEVQNKNIRLLFLAKLQQYVDGTDILHKKTNSVGFRNCVRMLGDFYNKGRMANGDPFPFLVAPLVENLQLLLESGQPQDLQLLTTQLFMNGTSIKKECLEQYNKLMNDIRLMLISNNELTKESKIWLLLCLDGSSNRFGL
nr:uncharacterized protein LOC111503334 [Leptinotarsa decemlineata]